MTVVFPVPQTNHNLAILNVGAPAPGMNAAVRSAVRVALTNGHKIYGVSDGFQGLADGAVRPSAMLCSCCIVKQQCCCLVCYLH